MEYNVSMKAKDINKAINWGLGFTAAYFIGTAIAGAIKKHREQSGASGIGDIPAWNKNHIRSYISMNNMWLPDRVIIDPIYLDHLGRKLVQCYVGDSRIDSRTFWVNRENEEYLIKLCNRFGIKVEYRNPY